MIPALIYLPNNINRYKYILRSTLGAGSKAVKETPGVSSLEEVYSLMWEMKISMNNYTLCQVVIMSFKKERKAG